MGEIVGSKVGKSGSQQRNYSVNQVAPKGTRKIATLTRVAGGQKTVISWQDAPDDLFYRAGAKTKKTRKQLTVAAIRKAAKNLSAGFCEATSIELETWECFST